MDTRGGAVVVARGWIRAPNRVRDVRVLTGTDSRAGGICFASSGRIGNPDIAADGVLSGTDSRAGGVCSASSCRIGNPDIAAEGVLSLGGAESRGTRIRLA